MTDENKNRYNIENLPISDMTHEGLTPENINYIGAIGRMLAVQDQFIEDTLASQSKALFAEVIKQNKTIMKVQRLIFDIQEELRNHEARLKKLEIRVDKIFLEHRVNHSIEG